MRKALNENPMVQMAVLGVMAIGVGFLLFTRVLSGGSSEEAAPPPPAGTATEAGAAAPAAPSDAAPTGSAPATTPPATGAAPPATGTVPGAPAPGAVVESEFGPGPGLPEPVVSAYDAGKTVVILIEKRNGIDDKALLGSVARLRGRNDLAMFVVPAKNVSKYARITEGVQLDRAPALVVVRPKRLSKGTPEATVSYGFRGPESVNQAVEDALFDGKRATYNP